MLFKAGRKKHKRERQKEIGFHGNVNTDVEDNGLFKKSEDFPGFAFRIDKADKAEFKFVGKVIFPLNLYQKMFLYAANITKEISGLGMVERVDGDLRITDIFILEQEVTSGNTTLNNKDLAKKTIDIINAGGDPSKMKLWWHSHTNGGMFWSTTDDRCCEAYDNDQWLLSIVINCKKELRCRLDVYNPIRITLDYMPVVVEEPVSNLSELEEQCKTEMKEKVKEPATSFSYGYNANNEAQGNSYWKCGVCSFYAKDSSIVVAHMVRTHGYDRAEAWKAVEIDELLTESEDQPKEEEVNRDSPIYGNFEDLFDENKNAKFHALAYHDSFGIYWHWDVTQLQYFPIWGKKNLSRSEYAFVAECLATGVKVDKDFNAVV